MRKTDKIKKSIDIVQKELDDLYSELELSYYAELAADDDYIAIECPGCHGVGYISSDSKKLVCQTCKGRGWAYAKKYVK